MKLSNESTSVHDLLLFCPSQPNLLRDVVVYLGGIIGIIIIVICLGGIIEIELRNKIVQNLIAVADKMEKPSTPT